MEKQYKQMQDMELIKCMEEDEEAFNEIYSRYYKLVYFIAYEMCHNDADAKDVMQETFLKVRKAAKNLREEGKFKYWLNAVTVSKCKDLFKKNKYANRNEESVYVQNTQKEERRYMLPEKQMHFDNDKELLYHFIAQLPQSQREVLVLKYFSDLSLQEIAAIMNVSEGTVKSRLHYAKDGLRGLIEGYNGRENNQPLNFESIDVALTAAFLYAYQKQNAPLMKLHARVRSHVGSHALMAGGAILLGGLLLGGGYLLYHQGEDKVDVAYMEEYNPTYREAYFHLLDFAANRYDMEAKTKEQLNDVYEKYMVLKNTDNAYYRLLVDQNWIAMYEEALKK